MRTVHLGSSSEYVRIAWPPSFEKEGWAVCEVEVVVNCFRGTITPFLDVSDLQCFYAELKALYETLEGSAKISPLEGQFTLLVAGTGRGHIGVSGTAWSRATHENKLQFELELDQTFLKEPLAQLEALVGIESKGNV
jgi:hypothetical protein